MAVDLISRGLASQILGNQLKTANNPSQGQIPAYDSTTGQFLWVDNQASDFTKFEDIDASRASIIHNGDEYTLSTGSYVVGTDTILVSVNNLLMVKNINYQEIGIVGSTSNKIKFLFQIEIDDPIHILSFLPSTNESKSVKCSDNDSQSGFLEDKIIGSSGNIIVSTQNDGGNEKIKINVGENVLTTSDITDVSTGTSSTLVASQKAVNELRNIITAYGNGVVYLGGISEADFLAITSGSPGEQYKALEEIVVGTATILENALIIIKQEFTGRVITENDFDSFIGESLGTQSTSEEIDLAVTKINNFYISSGTVVKPTITYNNGGTITIGEGTYRFFQDVYYKEAMSEHIIEEATLSVPDLITSYIVANYNSGTPQYSVTTDLSTINFSNNIAVYTCSRVGDTNIDILDWDEPALGLANKLLRRDMETRRFERVTGLGLSEDTGRKVVISAGVVWQGSFRNSRIQVDSVTNYCEQVVTDIDGNWTGSVVTAYNNSQFDNGYGLTTLTDGNYAVNWIYRGMGINADNIIILLGTGDYDLNQAKTAQPPNAPSTLSTNAMLIGKIIVLKGNTTATQIDSAFITQFAPSATTSHEGLTNIQGGDATYHYHSDQEINKDKDVEFNSLTVVADILPKTTLSSILGSLTKVFSNIFTRKVQSDDDLNLDANTGKNIIANKSINPVADITHNLGTALLNWLTINVRNVTSNDALSLNAGGTNKDITLTPSGIGEVDINGNVDLNNKTLRLKTPNLTDIGDTNGISFYEGNDNYKIGYDSVGGTKGYLRYNVDLVDVGHGHIFSAGDLASGETNLMLIRADGNVGIGTANPDSKAILDLTSTSKGFLLPRMTTIQRGLISTPSQGLLVFDTDLSSTLQYIGTSWVKIKNEPEACVINTEYLSPEQHGGIYGTVYRQYFNVSLPSSLTSGNTVAMLIDYSIRYVTASNRGVVRGWSADGTNSAVITLTGTSGKGNLLLTLTGAFTAAWMSWVDYTK